jgi:hypothetical protein
MTPQTPCCHHPAGWARGQMGPGNLVVQSHVEPRYRCQPCGHTFAAPTGPPFYRLHTAAAVVTIVLRWRCHGCPSQAMVAAFGVDERPVATWGTRAGRPCQQGQVDLPQVQADELWVKRVGRRVWMAMALAVPSRWWRGGGVSPQRDRGLITTLVQMVRSGARRLALLVGVDGWASDVPAFLPVCRYRVRPGGRGRPRLGLEPGVLLGQVVKRYARRRVVSGVQQGVRGTVEAIAAVREATGSGTGIKTASIARLHAPLRRALTPLVRRGRAMAHTAAPLSAGLWLVGWAYHCCWWPVRLRVAAPAGACWTWQERTPALAAGLTNQRWTSREGLRSQVPRSPWVAAQRRGRSPKQARPPARALPA